MKRETQQPSFDLDTPVLHLPDEGGALIWTIRQAVEGLSIFGNIGSGKTSGSGKTIALKYLALDFGGLVLTAKPDEADTWRDYCRQTGRTRDLIVIEPGQDNYFNFLEYESSDRGGHRSFTENIVDVLKTVLRASNEKTVGKQDDQFWETALDMLMFHIIDLCQLAYGNVTVQQFYDVAQSLPKKPVEKAGEAPKEKTRYSAYDLAFIAAQKRIEQLTTEFQEANDLQDMPWTEFERQAELAIPELRRMKLIDNFFFEVLKNLSEKTRSVIDFSFLGFLFGLLREPVYSLFCQHSSTFTPEDCYTKGRIIVINLPVKEYHKVGRDCQIMFKYIWQRAMEKRRIKDNERPVFLWADEAQHFLHEHDAEFQATARSSRIATVYLSQNLPNYYANMGGKDGQYRVKAFQATLATKIFHANSDPDTCNFSSDLIGEAYQKEESESTAVTEGTPTVTQTISAKLAKMVRPESFPALKTGGPLNEGKVQAYILLQGKTFSSGFHYKKITFRQY